MAHVSLTFPDGNQRSYPAGVTAAEVAADLSKSLSKKAISAQVDGRHWDLQWPIEDDAAIAINTMADREPALELVRHDLAHIMARAVQALWPEVQVTIGPVIETGWYYDFDRAEPFTPEDLGAIETKMREIIAARDPVTTEVWDRARAIAHYEHTGEPYKVELVEAIPAGEPVRMYWHGDWQDLCRGPHLQHTGQVPADAFKLMHVAGAYWRGDSSRAMLQRIYGVAFLNRAELKAHLTMLEEAAKRDHRKLGREMDLFHMQEEAPGQVFWHPNGWTIYTTLQDYMRRKQRAGGYREINTPQVVDRKLWEASGHWDKYQHHMFVVEVDESRDGENDDAAVKDKGQTRINALKPMNCPCHVQVFNQGLKSYRDLPLRLAEFGSCARFEPSGALQRHHCACAASPRTTRISSAPKSRSSTNARASLLSWPMSIASWASTISRSASPPAPKSAWGRMKAGTTSRARWKRRSRPWAATTRWNPATAPSTGPSWIST